MVGNVFEYVVVFTSIDPETHEETKSEIIAKDIVLAKDENTARLMAATKIPPTYEFNQIDVLIRNFR